MLNEIKLVGIIGSAVTSAMVKTLLARMDQTQPLYVHIDSDGGSVTEGFRLHDAFAAYPGPKKCIIEPTAFSIASYIATAFDEVEIVENGYLMIHRPMLDVESANADELAANSAMVAKMDTTLVNAYANKTGMSAELVKDLMAKETYLNAEEAVKYGFASSIVKRSVPKLNLSNKVPHFVYASLCCEVQSGEICEPTKEKAMSTTQQVAATIEEIEAAFPKMKPATVLACIKKKMPIASVATAAVEEMMAENAMLQEKCMAMEQELASFKAAEVTIETPEEEMQPEAKAVAKLGVKAVTRVSSGVPNKSAREEWESAVQNEVKNGKPRSAALAAVNKKYPGLRDRFLAEVNS